MPPLNRMFPVLPPPSVHENGTAMLPEPLTVLPVRLAVTPVILLNVVASRSNPPALLTSTPSAPVPAMVPPPMLTVPGLPDSAPTAMPSSVVVSMSTSAKVKTPAESSMSIPMPAGPLER